MTEQGGQMPTEPPQWGQAPPTPPRKKPARYASPLFGP
jgi:hypothetical protein